MKRLFFLISFPLVFLASCEKQIPKSNTQQEDSLAAQSLVRVNATSQGYLPTRPWEKEPPSSRRGLGILLGKNRILTTADIAAKATFISLESANEEKTVPAKTVFVDYECNLAILEPTNTEEPSFLDELVPIQLQKSGVKPRGPVTIWQIESSGLPLKTEGSIQSTDIISTSGTGHYFLTYRVKASMQSASSSYTLPVTQEGKLLGILTSYYNDDQICDVIAPEVIQQFIADTEDAVYDGFPSLGISAATTEDPHFRSWLNLAPEQGGIYITRVVEDSSAGKAGLKKGDVILSIDGNQIDRKGYYQHPHYHRIYWTHLIRGEKSSGDQIQITIKRNDQIIKKQAILARSKKPLIQKDFFASDPSYLIHGGLIFTELSKPYLQGFGKDWESRAPITLLDALANPEDYETDRDRIIILSQIIPTPATVGYDRISNQIVTQVNDISIRHLSDLQAALNEPKESYHVIDIKESPYRIFLDVQESEKANTELIQRGLDQLSRFETRQDETK